MPSTTCTFASSRGHDLSARLEQPAGPVRGTAVFAHCFTCGKDLRAVRRIAGALRERGIAVLSFDFSGLGSSDGEFAATTFSSDVNDLVAAADYLAEQVAAPSLLVGHSLGGAAVLAAADRISSVTAVATIGAPADVQHVRHLLSESDRERIRQDGAAQATIAGRRFTVGADFLTDLETHDLVETVGALQASLLLLHSPIDDTVGVENARRLYDAARHPKSYISLDDADHLLAEPADAEYAAAVISAWAARYLPQAPASRPRDGTSIDDATVDGARGDDVARAYDDDRVVAVSTDGLKAQARARGFDLTVDEPRSAGGTETGPTPYDLLGAALASCTTLTLRMYADRKDIPLEQVRAEVTHERVHARDCEHCERSDGYLALLTRRLTLTGDLTQEQRADLVRIADRCPVHRTLEGPIEVRTVLS